MATDSSVGDKKGNTAGTILRRTRETLGLSLDDGARVTRIGKGHLAALEEGLYERLPSAVYVKGFLRVYAAYLKLSENEVLLAYEKDLSDLESRSVGQEPLHLTEEKEIKKSARRIRWSFVLPVVLVIATASALSYLFLSPPGKKSPNAERFAALSSAAKPAAIVTPPIKTMNSSDDLQVREQPEGVKKANNSEATSAASPSPKGMVLKLKVVEDGWLDITIDDAVTQHYVLKSGDLIEWKGEKSFSLDVGNAGGVEAELDGKTLKPFGKSGETAHVVLKTGGVTP